MTRMATVLPDVEYVMLDSDDDLARCWHALRTCGRPVVVVPPGADAGRRLGRALLPLDGTETSTAAVRPLLALLAGAGVEIVVLHVFTADTVPAYWDQSVHATAVWQREFRTRHSVPAAARLVLRDGRPGDTVLDVAVREGVDLIALGWSGRHDEGRAETVRQAVHDAQVPVLLVPVDGHEPVDRHHRGPSPHPAG